MPYYSACFQEQPLPPGAPYPQSAQSGQIRKSSVGVPQPPDEACLVKLQVPEQLVHFLRLKVITFNKLQRARAVELKTIGFAVIRKTRGSDDCGTILKGTLKDNAPVPG